jgi:hypothetical protein
MTLFHLPKRPAAGMDVGSDRFWAAGQIRFMGCHSIRSWFLFHSHVLHRSSLEYSPLLIATRGGFKLLGESNLCKLSVVMNSTRRRPPSPGASLTITRWHCGIQANPPKKKTSQGCGLPPVGVWSRPRWDPPCADKKERVGRLLVVRLWRKTIAWALVWRMPRVEARVPCPQKEG